MDLLRSQAMSDTVTTAPTVKVTTERYESSGQLTPHIVVRPDDRIFVINVGGKMLYTTDENQITPIIDDIFMAERARLFAPNDKGQSPDAESFEVFRRETEGCTEIYSRAKGILYNGSKKLELSILYGPATRALYKPNPPPFPNAVDAALSAAVGSTSVSSSAVATSTSSGGVPLIPPPPPAVKMETRPAKKTV